MAATDLGDRGRPWAGTAAGSTADRRRGTRAGRAAEAGRPGTAPGHRADHKNDDNDARSVAVAALRARALPELVAEDQTMVMRVWARRYHDLGRLRTQAVCRVHAVLCELVPGGVRKHVRTSQAIELLDRIVADSPIAQAKLALARELIADLHRIDQQRRDAKRRTAQAVAASGTSITSIYGVGPIVAGTVLGYVRDTPPLPHPRPIRLLQRHRPIEVSSGDRVIHRLSRRGNRHLNHAIHMAAVTQISRPGSEGRAYYQRKIADGMGRKAGLRALKRTISDTLHVRVSRAVCRAVRVSAGL